MTDATTDETEAPPLPGVGFTLDGAALRAHDGELLIAAAERHGVYIPRFCYHERMKPVGMCRMCLVEVDTGRGPALQPSCMLAVTEGMVVETASPATKKAQDGVLEFLLINHPLDCPVCDKGGECPLQDQTMAYGPGESRYVEEKRHKEKPIPISDLVLLDRERCILCDRCTRFAKDVAGDPLIHFIHRGNQSEVNTFPDHPFASYFSGNTVQICPVGALTASTYRFKARPWDLEQAESTCTSCAVGCRVALQSSRNEVLRKLGVDVDPVNWGWLCDKGRFDVQHVHHPDRLGQPLVRHGDDLLPVRWNDAQRRVAAVLAAARDGAGPGSIAVLGGARLSNESAYAWSKLAKGVLGTDNVDCQLGDGLPAEVVVGLPKATIDDACRPGGTVVVIAADVREELPVLFLRLRHAVVEDGVRLVELTPQPTGLTALAAASLSHRPSEAGEAARALLGSVPPGRDGGGVDPSVLETARRVVAEADGPLTVIVGRQSSAESPQFVVDAADAFLAARPDTRFLTAVRRANTHGALDMGLAPGLLPGRVSLDEGAEWFTEVWGRVPSAHGLDATGILQAAAEGRIEVLVLLGADPVQDFPDRALAEQALERAGTVVAVDLFLTESSRRADVVLAAAGFGETEGSTTNLEGRVSHLEQRVTPPGTARPDWLLAAELALLLGSDLDLDTVEAVQREVAQVAPAYAGLTPEVLVGAQSGDGVVVPVGGPSTDAGGAEAEADGDGVDADAGTSDAAADSAEAEADGAEAAGAPEAAPLAPALPPMLVHAPGEPVEPPAPDAYGLRLVASRKLYDLGTLVQASPALAGLPPGTELRVNPYDFVRLGVTAGTRVRVKSPHGVVEAPVAVDAGLPRGAAALTVNQPDVEVGQLIDAGSRVTDVRIDTGAAS